MRRSRPLSRLSNGFASFVPSVCLSVCVPLSPVCVGRPLLEMRCHSMARRMTETEARRMHTAQHDRYRHDWWMHHHPITALSPPYPCDSCAAVCDGWRAAERITGPSVCVTCRHFTERRSAHHTHGSRQREEERVNTHTHTHTRTLGWMSAGRGDGKRLSVCLSVCLCLIGRRISVFPPTTHTDGGRVADRIEDTAHVHGCYRRAH